MSDTEIKKGETWVNKLDETNTVTITNVGDFFVTGSSIKDGNYMASRDDFLHYFKLQPKENVLKPDMVNKPPHYKDASGIECKEITCHRKMPFSLGNAIKYLYRAGSKGDLMEDLKKAEWYLRVAYLNDERVPKAVEVRLLEVAAHRKTEAGGALNLIRLHEIAAAYQAVKKEIEKLEAVSI